MKQLANTCISTLHTSVRQLSWNFMTPSYIPRAISSETVPYNLVTNYFSSYVSKRFAETTCVIQVVSVYWKQETRRI